MKSREPDNPALAKYARVGRVLAGRDAMPQDQTLSALVEIISRWTEQLQLPCLARYGVGASDLAETTANCRGSSMKNKPIVLSGSEATQILAQRL